MTQIRSASYVVLGDDSTPLMLWDGDTLNFMVAIDVGDSGIVDTTYLATVSGDIITQVNQDISDLIGTAPAVLDTLGELSDAIGDDPNFITTMASGLAACVSDSDMVTISGDIVAQIPTDFYTQAEVTTISGDIVAQFPTDFYSQAEVTTISGDIVAQIPDVSDFITDGEVATISGDIVGQIPSLAGYATTVDLTTASGDIVAQIPVDYIDSSEMTTISGDIVGQIPSLAGYATDAEVSTISGDIMAQVLKKDGSVALTGDLLPATSGVINLGSAAMPFGDIFTVSGTIYMDGQEALSMSAGVVSVGGVAITSLGGVSIVTAAYTGDGSTSKAITGLGGQPTRLELYCSDDASNFDSAGNVTKFLWFSGMATTNMLSVELGTQLTGRLVAIGADGFTISDNGDDSPPNQNGKKCKYLAWI